MVYTIIENPPPGKRNSESITTVQSFNDDEKTLSQLSVGTSVGELLESRSRTQPYVVISNQPIILPARDRSNPTIIQPIIINNNLSAGSAVISARYENSGSINSITSRTLFTNNGLGSRTQDNNTPNIWTLTTNTIDVQSANEIIEVQIRFTASTDTLGGAFELELESILNSFVIDKQEFNINIQDQDYTAVYKVLTTTNDAAAGIRIYITPELGMTLNLTDIEFIFIKSFTA